MKENVELNSCPRCKSTHTAIEDETLYAYHAKCYNCGLDIREPYKFRRYGNLKTSYEVKEEQESMQRAKKKVIRRWNMGEIENQQPVPMPRYWAY